MIGVLETSNRHRSGVWGEEDNLPISGKNIYKRPGRKVEEEASGD